MAKHNPPPEPPDPCRLLVEAHAAFIGCDHDRGSTLLWQAAEFAMVNLAKQMERPHDTEGDDLLFLCQWLDQQTGTRDYTGGYTAASLFGDNAKYHFIEKEELEFVWPEVNNFIAALTSYSVPAEASRERPAATASPPERDDAARSYTMARHTHPPEHSNPYRLLADADAAFAAGDHYLGSALLWESAECALVNLAKRCGHPHDTEGDDLLFFSKWLDKQTGTRYYSGGHTTASLFGNNAKYRFIEPEEMEISIPRVHHFISALTTYPAPPKTS